jgi:hypothetical protein
MSSEPAETPSSEPVVTPGGETAGMSSGASGGVHAGASAQVSEEEEMRAAYEAELSRITSVEMILQSTVSLLNIGGRRLGLSAPSAAQAQSERDLTQVSDAIDAARALMGILERRMPAELGPLRDAIAQLQMAYAREVQAAQPTAASTTAATQSSTVPQSSTAPNPAPAQEPADRPAEKPAEADEGEQRQGPGPAQASGRLWVPGR